MVKDLGKNNISSGYAVFLPAISNFYVRKISQHYCEMTDMFPPERIPQGFENGLEGLNIFDKDKGYVYYSHGLYSAGHAELDLEKSKIEDGMVVNRDRETTVLVGDSGGYQIGTGAWKLDWTTFYDKEGDWADTRHGIMRWLEEYCDYSMTLDVPGWSCLPQYREKNGIKNWDECVEKTIFNHEYFINNRIPGKTKFLNTLHGSSWDTSEKWYQQVKHFNDKSVYGDRAFEGYAMAGDHAGDAELLLRRLIRLRDDGLLGQADQSDVWIHTLGISVLPWGAMLTAIQRQLRKHVNPNLTISFDAASPYITAAKGLAYDYPDLNSNAWSYKTKKLNWRQDITDDNQPWLYEGEIGSRLNMRDINYMQPGMLNRNKKEAKSSWDSLSYILIQAHNAEYHIRGMQDAIRRFDHEYEMLRDKIDINTMNLGKTNTLSDVVPDRVLYFAKFVEVLFDPNTKDPMNMLTDYKAFLRKCEGSRVQNIATTPDFMNFEEAGVKTEEYVEAVKGKKKEYEHPESVDALFG